MTAPVTLTVDRVSKLHTTANALPGLRSHQLQLALHDMVAHQLHAGQHLWLHATPAATPAAPPLPLPAPVWLLVQAWAHAAVAPGTTRVQLSSSSVSLSAAAAVQAGDAVSLQPLPGPLLPATAITLRRLVLSASSDGASSDETPSSRSGTEGSLQPAIDKFISAALLNRPCHLGMPVSVELFSAAHHLVIDHVEPAAPLDLDPTSPPAVYTASADTDFTFTKHSAAVSANQPANDAQAVDFSAIGGLESELASVRELIELPLLNPGLFTSFSLRPPRGLLLYGPPGTGKTMIARAIASAAFARFYAISGGEIVSRYVGESEQRLTQTFHQAATHAPAVIFIDEIDSLCPRRDTTTDPLPKRLVATLLTLMDGMTQSSGSDGGGGGECRVVVLAATNRPDAIDPALRRPGRFDREVEIGIPNERARRDILARMRLAAGDGWLVSEEELDEVAKVTHGHVGADLKALCREAAMAAMKRHTNRDVADMLGSLSISHAVPSAAASALPLSLSSDPSSLRLTYADFLTALPLVRPSSMRSITLDIPTTRFSDIGGQHDIKQRLHEAVHWPLTNPAAFTRLGIQPPRGILLYGPPGCSKTLLARALACESRRNFIAVRGPELFSKWVGESEKAVKEVFRKARAAAPSIVFFDEVDSIAASRSAASSDRVSQRVLSQLLSELDGLHALRGVVTLAATNRPDLLDPALLRPGRIDRLLYVSPPSRADAIDIAAIELRRMAVEPAVTSIGVVEALERRWGADCVWSGAELAGLCREAGLAAMEEDVQCKAVDMRHFERAIARAAPRLDRAMLRFYDDYSRQHSMQSI